MEESNEKPSAGIVATDLQPGARQNESAVDTTR